MGIAARIGDVSVKCSGGGLSPPWVRETRFSREHPPIFRTPNVETPSAGTFLKAHADPGCPVPVVHAGASDHSCRADRWQRELPPYVAMPVTACGFMGAW